MIKEEKRKLVLINKRQGRAVQSKLARRLGGKSVGTIERQDISFNDPAKPWSVEAKHRKKFLGDTFMAQAVKNCPKGKTPLVVVHTLNQNFNNSLVLIRLKDWENWYGKI